MPTTTVKTMPTTTVKTMPTTTVKTMPTTTTVKTMPTTTVKTMSTTTVKSTTAVYTTPRTSLETTRVIPTTSTTTTKARMSFTPTTTTTVPTTTVIQHFTAQPVSSTFAVATQTTIPIQNKLETTSTTVFADQTNLETTSSPILTTTATANPTALEIYATTTPNPVFAATLTLPTVLDQCLSQNSLYNTTITKLLRYQETLQGQIDNMNQHHQFLSTIKEEHEKCSKNFQKCQVTLRHTNNLLVLCETTKYDKDLELCETKQSLLLRSVETTKKHLSALNLSMVQCNYSLSLTQNQVALQNGIIDEYQNLLNNSEGPCMSQNNHLIEPR
jgi:hypothetical protein